MNGKLPLNWNLQHKGIQLALDVCVVSFPMLRVLIVTLPY